MYRFLLRPGWIVMHVVLLGAVLVFAVAGLWQLRRLDERKAHNQTVLSQRAMPAVTSLRNTGAEAAHRTGAFTGTYDTDHEFVLVGRSHRGRPGNHVLTPLVVESGRAILVDRGWVPPLLDAPPVTEAAPPAGRVRVRGLLNPSEGAAPIGSQDGRPTPRISRIDLERLAAQIPYEVAPVYLLLREQDPAGQELPLPVDPPELGEGSHLVYAVQWFSFIPIALIGYGVLVRRESRKDGTVAT